MGGWHRLYSGVAHRLRFSFLQTAGYSPPSLVFLFITHYSLLTASLLPAYSAVFNFNLLLFSSKNARKLSAVSSNRTHCS